MTDIPPIQPPPEDPPIPHLFDKADRLTIVFLASLLILSSIAFFLYVRWHGLLDFGTEAAVEQDRYFLSALEFRERRLSLTLTFRTFLITLGFVVGLVLSALGGLFLLRRASMKMNLSGVAPEAQGAKFGLILDSPGVAFMLGGVAVIVVTQILALPVGAPEIFPRDARALCSDIQTAQGTCSTRDGSGANSAKLDAFCAANPEDADCVALSNLNTRLEVKR